jgi:hypothetical protein
VKGIDMKLFILLVIIICINISLIDANEIGFIETFSLAKDRKTALQQLIPGSSDYYYYNCLNHQHRKEFDQTDGLLKQWIKREGYTEQVKEVLNRQALLRYQESPSKSLNYIQDELNLYFNHQKEIDTHVKKHASRLNQNIISINTLKKQAFSRYRDLSGFEDAGLDILSPDQLSPDQLRHYLKRLRRPDIQGLAKLVIRDLEAPHSSGFGGYHIHKLMFKNQLDECLKYLPGLIDNSNFVDEYIRKLAPADNIVLHHDLDEKKAYLLRLWQFVENLSPPYNSLKANVLFHLLDFNRKQGDYSQTLFIEYLKLPKHMHYINQTYFKYHHDPVDLNADYEAYTLLPPIISDEALITDYLKHFFVTDQTSYNRFHQYLDDTWIQNIYVETNIVNMKGDMEEWFSLIPQHQFQEIKERVDIDFAIDNQSFFSVDDPVKLQLHIKNVNTLIVKIFEINTFNYYSTFYKEPDTHINLDGLSPTHEEIYTYDAPPFLRSLKTFDFPKINKPGVFVVEFIGNGKSSRALIRKGKLFFIESIGPAGHEFKVFNENNQNIPDAVIQFDGYEYKPDNQGIIIIPFRTHPEYQPVIIKHQDFCSLSGFDHLSEHYALDVGFYVDRESLLPQMTSKVLIRPNLRLNDHPISLSLLKDISLTIESTDIDGVSANKEIQNFMLFEDQESVYEFQVPENLASIHFELSAKIDNISQQKTESLKDDAVFKLNGIDQTPHFENLLLHHENNTYTLEVLGKNGEPRIHRAVKIELKHKYFSRNIFQHFQTDKNGRIHLGVLKNISHIKASCANDYSYKWHLFLSKAAYPSHVNSHANETIQLPYDSNNFDKNCALFEKRGSTWLADKSHAITYKKGCIQIKGLVPGNYDLFIKPIHVHITICIDKGILQDNIILSDHRALKIENSPPPFIDDIDINDNEIVIKIGNINEFTRLHVLATRFMPAYSIVDQMLPIETIAGNCIQISKPVSHYISGRNIGDEYRYILDRKYVDKYPGNMLSKPGLLLNPWCIRNTDTQKQELKPDELYKTNAPVPEMSLDGAPENDHDRYDMSPKSDRFSTFNFLNETSLMRFNLKPEKKGLITLKRKEFNAFRHIHFLLADPSNTVYRSVSFPKSRIVTRDVRLQKSFNLDQHFTEQKRISILQAGETLTLTDITTTKFEIYDSVEKVFDLLRTISKDSVLTEFEFIVKWPDLDKTDKQKFYSEKACHELNFFLFHKDRPFFNDVILPYIRNKKDNTFMDHWLLEKDLSAYTALFAFSNLNIAEKILFARHHLSGSFQIARYVNDLFDILPQNIETYNHLYDIALKGKALEMATVDYDIDDISMDENELREEPLIACSVKEEIAYAPPKHAKKMRYVSRKKERSRTRAFFKKLEKTNEWAENNYYKRPQKEQNEELIQVNAFWKDFAEHDAQKPFLSKNLMVANKNFSEIMLALAVLDLPFRENKHAMIKKGKQCSIKAASPMVIFHKEILQGELIGHNQSILINQHFFQLDDRYVYVNNERMDKFVENEFLYGISYGSQVVLSNPTSSNQKLVVMYQIPEGSIPVMKGKYTEGISVTLKPFSTKSIEYYFYFPKTGNYSSYPIQVAKEEKCIASTKAKTFTVVQKLSSIDTQSWKYVSQHGSNNDVIQYLNHNNLNRIDLGKIAFRMKNKSFFRQVITLLQNRQFFHPVLWSYGIYHQNHGVINEYLAHSNFANTCGMYIDSPLLTINPITRNMYEHLEYAPFVNARVHQVGKKRSLLNDQFFRQYNQFLKYLSYRPFLNANDRIAVTCYLLTQDRVSQAIHFFNSIDRKDVESKIQYDYIHAYILMYQEKTTEVEKIITPYLNYPVLRWQKRFLAVLSQLDEMKGKAPQVIDKNDRNQRQLQLAATEKNFEFNITAQRIHITYQNISHCQINYYPMDIELLFSRSPFVQKQTNEFMIIQPDETTTVSLPENETAYEFDLPEKYHNSNLIVEITAQGKKVSRVCYANSLHLQLIEHYGQLKLTHETTQRPLSKAYVKVYAQLNNKNVQFHKDGYTDLRGYFDYVSLNTDDLDRIEKFAILVIDEKYGAVTRVAMVPKR